MRQTSERFKQKVRKMTSKASPKHMSSGITFTGSGFYAASSSTSSAASVSTTALISPYRGSRNELGRIEKAVYAHIKAIRTLGRTSINTAEIAQALSIPMPDVTRAVSNLRDKGVKPLA